MIVKHFTKILYVCGVITMLPILLFFIPWPMFTLTGMSMAANTGVLFAKHWGLLAASIGGLLFYSAMHPPLRRPIVIAAAIEKLGLCVIIAVGWIPYLKRTVSLWWRARQIAKQVRILEHGTSSLRKILARFPASEIDDQPMPSRDRSDDRYELLSKLQRLLKPMGFTSIIVLVDRVDEPHLINGSAERMRDFLWSMFDNKFLKHPGIGFKMLLPRDVVYFLNREEKEFYERSRLDKQNLINSLEWTGESLFDMATNRIRACQPEDTVAGDAAGNAKTSQSTIRDFFADDVSREDLIARFAKLRVPRHLFRFLYRLLTEHCNRATEDQPSWKISRRTLETITDTYARELEAFDRGLGTG